MNQPAHFGPFLLFRETGSNSYRSCFRAGIASGRAIERVVRLEIYDQPGFDPSELLIHLETSAELQAKLQDPHIAGGAGVGHVEGIPWVAYEFELGTTLTEFLAAARERDFPVPLDQALFIAERVALALAAAYRLENAAGGVFHSFLTPDAVLLSNVGAVKVCGFEVGRALRDRLAGEPVFAPYLSPECRAGQAPRAQDDVFSLGSLLFELVTGKPISSESTDLEKAIVQSTGEPVPRELLTLLRSSLANLSERIPNVHDWQRNVGRLILDGDYNPTTFNLSFMMHTVLREPLERGVESLEREKRFVLPAAGENPAASLPTGASSKDAPSPSDSGSRELAPNSGTGPLDRSEVRSQLPTPTPSDRRPFWAGFSISVVAASAALAALMLMGGGSKSAPARTADHLEPPGESGEAFKREPQGSSRPTATPQPEGPHLVRTEVVQGQIGNAAENLEVQRMVAERAAEIERSLAAKYEQKLEELRREMIENEALEPQSPEALEGSSVPGPPRAGEPQAKRPTEEVREPIPSRLETGVLHDSPDPATSEVVRESREGPHLGEPGEPIRGEPRRANLPSSAVETLRAPDTLGAVQPVPTELPGREATSKTSGDSAAPIETPPRLLRLSPPAYPPAARRLGLSATARVQVVISPQGRVRDAQILGPQLGGGFDRAAIAAVHRSKWQPATRNGEPVESTTVLTLEFQP